MGEYLHWSQLGVGSGVLANQPKERKPLTEDEIATAAAVLARLFSAHCRVDIHPPDLIALLRNHWAKVSPLAHAIHEGREP